MNQDFNAHRALEDAERRHEHALNAERRWIPIAAAVIAVFAALATLFSNQRSTVALVAKNEAILAQTKASDQYNYYESKRIKYHLYAAFADAHVTSSVQGERHLRSVARKEEGEAKPILVRARKLEHDSTADQERSEMALKSHEVLEVAVTLFEVSIVFVSISALTTSRVLGYVAAASTAVGMIFLFLGLAVHR